MKYHNFSRFSRRKFFAFQAKFTGVFRAKAMVDARKIRAVSSRKPSSQWSGRESNRRRQSNRNGESREGRGKFRGSDLHNILKVPGIILNFHDFSRFSGRFQIP